MTICTALLVLTASVSQSAAPSGEPPIGADTATASQPATRAAEEVEEVRLSVGRVGEYDTLIAELKLEGEQLEAFKAKDAERLTTLRAFVEGPEGKQLIALREEMAAARRARRTAEVPVIRAKLQPFSDRYWEVRNNGRRELMKTLTEPQIARVAGSALYTRVMRNLPTSRLSDEQRQQARVICDETAAQWFKMPMLETDPYFRELTPIEAPTRDRVTAEVLTDEQREAMKRPTTRPTTRRAARPTQMN